MKNLLLAGLLLSLAIPAHAASVSHAKTKEKVDYIVVKGSIDEGDSAKFNGVLSKYPKSKFVVLDSPGGLVGEGMAISVAINEHKLATYVMKNDYCESICSIMFFSGVKRYISVDAHLGVHSAYDGATHKRDDETNSMIAWYLGYLGYNKGLVDLWVSAEPSQINTITDKINKELDLGIQVID